VLLGEAIGAVTTHMVHEDPATFEAALIVSKELLLGLGELGNGCLPGLRVPACLVC
jgi:hypothetical protein